jgi:CHAT domain-containing protein
MTPESEQPPMVMADPDFGTGPGPKLGDKALEPLRRLNASSVEAIQIKNRIAGTNIVMEGEATKNMLKEVSRPQLLHIATHGFFLEDESDAQTTDDQRSIVRRTSDGSGLDDNSAAGTKLDNPLLRSGLFFAGANTGSDEATLTAMEASGLDLWGTKLVVLSACDTGVGEVKNGEGVYGLRRALVLAGSESQMMSLWPVSDRGTRDLMISYYEALKAGEGRSAGLRKVRLAMLKNPARRHPYYWASFILSGEWASLDGKRQVIKNHKDTKDTKNF